MKHRTILVIDGDPAWRDELSRWLVDEGYRVVVGEDGPTGVDLALTHQPDLVVLDLRLPMPNPSTYFAFDGFTVMRWLSRFPGQRTIPTIVVSSASGQSTKAEALSAGASAFFGKPVVRDRLIMALRIALDDLTESPSPTEMERTVSVNT